MNGLSLFANVGIAETYLKDVGVDIVVANELEEDRARFYSHLYPSCNMICGDITNDEIKSKIIKEAIKAGCEFMIATPPCQGMSIAGHNSPYDERNSLIKYAIDVALELKPKYIMFENVTQQLVTPIKLGDKEVKIPEYMHIRLGEYYSFNDDEIINAADYGVPQRRERTIILLTRKDIDDIWQYPPKDERRINLDEALKGIPDLWPIVREREHQNELPENTPESLSFHKWHKPPTHCWRNILCMLYTPTGNTAFDNEYYYPRKANGDRIKGYDTTYHRMFWDKPAPTVTKYNGVVGSQNNVHPGKYWKTDENNDKMYTNPRVLTIYELMKVTSLPDDWDIPDWASENLIRYVIGEGIPPILVKRIVENIKELKNE